MPSFIYLDNSTVAQPSEKAVSAMLLFMTQHWGIPMAPHQRGQELFPYLENFYKTLYTFVGAKENDQVILTSSGTEAVNHVIFSAYRDITVKTGKNQYLASKVDEAAAIIAMSRLEPLGCVSKLLEVDACGLVTAENLAKALTPRTALVSISWANGLTGVIQPLKEISELCKQRGVRLHIDATHVMGKLDFDLEESGADFLTFNGDQLHAPKGSGVLYVKEGVTCSPFLYGSADQGGLRGGALNMSALAALACAAQEAIDCRDLLGTEVARLRNRLEKGVLKGFPAAQVCFKNCERLPHCTTFLFPGIANEAFLFTLNRKGICATIGGGNFQKLSLMLTSCGIEESLANTAVSFSLSRQTTEEEIDRAIVIVVEVAQSLGQISRSFLE